MVLSSEAAPPVDALLAEFDTSEGKFSVTLNYVAARRTVSHFMSLSQGGQPWLDEPTGKVQHGVPFYKNLKFKSYVDPVNPSIYYLKTGSRPGPVLEQTGPGYVMRDEIRRNTSGNQTGQLVMNHSQAYTVSMVTDAPHTNGSQFLINFGVGSQFDGKNTAFGVVNAAFHYFDDDDNPLQIYPGDGYAVVNAIYNASYLGQQVTIYGIRIRRIGPKATAFDATERLAELPTLSEIPITSLEHTPSGVLLGHASAVGGAYRNYASVDLLNWYFAPSQDVYYGPGSPANSKIRVSHGNSPRAFFRLLGVKYEVTTVPTALYGKKINVIVAGEYNVHFTFGHFGAPDTYQFSSGESGELLYNFTPRGPFHADLEVLSEEFGGVTYRLYFGGSNLEVSELEVMPTHVIELGEGSYPDSWGDAVFTISNIP